jgi:hypothetical protein
MSMTDMDDLIARLEKAMEPDLELDVAIVYALHPEIGPYRPHCVGDEPIFYQDPYYKQRCPKFTASIDAAMKLVPEGHLWKCGYSRHVPHVAEVVDYKNHGGTFVGECDSNRAIALCIAALRARSPR